jgi:uncharacterized protein YggT (Ycf19 family)
MLAKLLLGIVKTIVNLIELLFIARIGLRLLKADGGIGIVQLIYQWTDSLLGPVLRIFPSGLNIGYGVDGVAVLGLIFYAVAYFIIDKLFRLFFVAE